MQVSHSSFSAKESFYWTRFQNIGHLHISIAYTLPTNWLYCLWLYFDKRTSMVLQSNLHADYRVYVAFLESTSTSSKIRHQLATTMHV